MKWHSKSVDGTAEQDIIRGLICSDQFAKEIIPIISHESFQSQHTRILARWCIGYFQKYNKVPAEHITSIWQAEKEAIDSAIYDTVELMIEEIAKRQDDSFNLQYELDKAEHFLKKRTLENLKEEISYDLSKDDVAGAESRVAKFRRKEKYSGESIDVFQNTEAITTALLGDDDEDELFSLPGTLGKFVGPFSRGDLYAVAGPGKRGKTWWLQEIGMRGVFAKRKVLFISCEMMRQQMIRRIYQHVLGETRKPPREGEIIKIPFFENGRIEYREAEKEGIQLSRALKKRKDIQTLIHGGVFRLLCFPAYSVGVSTIEAHIDNLEYYDNFIPDIIIVDYADILLPELKGEVRHQIDHTWKSLRSIAQKRHCVVVTATHTNKATYSRDVEQGDLSEDTRKQNHVACMFSLNQDKDDKRNGIMRIKIMAQRHDSFQSDDQVIVLQNLSIGKPYLDSQFEKEIEI